MRDLLELMEEFEQVAPSGVGPTVEAILHRTGYLAELEAERTIESVGRVENLRELVGVCQEFDEALDSGNASVLAALADLGDGAEIEIPQGCGGCRRSSRASRSSPTWTPPTARSRARSR